MLPKCFDSVLNSNYKGRYATESEVPMIDQHSVYTAVVLFTRHVH